MGGMSSGDLTAHGHKGLQSCQLTCWDGDVPSEGQFDEIVVTLETRVTRASPDGSYRCEAVRYSSKGATTYSCLGQGQGAARCSACEAQRCNPDTRAAWTAVAELAARI